MIDVTWDDAHQYVAWLSKMTGEPYRLLTEPNTNMRGARGRQTAYPWGDDIGTNKANCDGCGSQWDNNKRRRLVHSPRMGSAL